MAGDPYWSEVVFAAHFDSSMTCSKGNAPSSVGANAVISSAQSKFGGSSIYLPNAVNSAVTYAAGAPAVAFGTADFCIDGWIYTTRSNVVALRIPGIVIQVSSGQFFVAVSDPDFNQQNISGAGSITNHGWRHFAVERWGDTVYAYVQGALGGSLEIGSMTLNSSGSLSLNYDSTARIGGYIDDLRITPRARFKGAFSVPTEAFPEFYDAPANVIFWD